jgi:hypothetical protein
MSCGNIASCNLTIVLDSVLVSYCNQLIFPIITVENYSVVNLVFYSVISHLNFLKNLNVNKMQVKKSRQCHYVLKVILICIHHEQVGFIP